jgi:hypothetical protein
VNVDNNQLKRFSALFKGNTRSYGQLFPNKPKSKAMLTVKEPYDDGVIGDHLSGLVGLGIAPIRDDGMAYWGAIDIDNHGSTEDLDLISIENKIKLMSLPLITCRSKSGGAHLYLFGREPLRADMLKTVLTKWMNDLKLEGSDCVFPKQTRLPLDSNGDKALGNWINLPYFGGDDTDRYAIDSGERCSFDLFLTNAETTAITQEQLEGLFGSEHSEAPPCIRKALREGIGEGSRNDTLFHITIYNRKRNPEGAREMSHSMQPELFTNPLSFSEADKVIKSAARKSYGYLCKKDPWMGWCDKEACRKVKYGISESEYETLLADTKLPLFSDLVKYMNTEPVMWEVKMNGVPITLSTEELMDYRVVRVRAMEKLHTVLPSKIKAGQWTDEILANLMHSLVIEEAPLESSPMGVLNLRLEEFLRKSDLSSEGIDPRDRECLLRGMPVVQMHKGDKVVMFRSIDYEDYLKRTRTEVPRSKNLWHRCNREMGVCFDRVRVKQQLVSIWYVDFKKISEVKHEAVDFNPEF